MSVYWELKDETGFDPMAPGPQIEPWLPWSLRGAWEVLLNRSDMTVWTRDNARQLNQMLVQDLVTTQPQPPLVVREVTVESPMEDLLAIGEDREA